MPETFVVPVTTSSATPSTILRVSDIVGGASQDVRNTLAATGSDATLLIDYTNRIYQKLCRAVNWKYFLSSEQTFITQKEQTDYWFGATGSAPAGTVETGLNITNLKAFKEGTVIDRTNLTGLKSIKNEPTSSSTSFASGRSRPGPPKGYLYDPINAPYVISLLPAPDNSNSYQETPAAPILTTTAGGSLSARTYYVKVSIVDSKGGESNASSEAIAIYVPANYLLVVKSPHLAFTKSASGVTYSYWNVYVGTATNTETKQNTALTAIDTDWTEPITGLLSGVSIPTANTLEPLYGYVIEFRYWKTRSWLTQLSDVIELPITYKDVLIAGVNYYAFTYLDKPILAATWKEAFALGMRDILVAENITPKGGDFIKPDMGCYTVLELA